VSSRPLTEKEREKLTVYLHKGAAGEWSFDVLANEFEIPDLIEWGFMPYELGIAGDPNDPNEEWQGMPEFEQEDNTGEYHTIKVHFTSAADIENFAQIVGQVVNEKTKFIWYPKQEKLDLKSYRVKDES
jgi:hypothetical protein